jgi:hypothetical protein
MPQISQTLINDNYAPYRATASFSKNYTAQDSRQVPSQDILTINVPAAKQAGTKTISDTVDANEDGFFRRTRIFEQEDGRRFSKLEEITFTPNSVRKTVAQQNPSGSISQYEEVLDAQSDGTYRRTQRFTDGTGETSTQITLNYTPRDSFVLSGGQTGFGGVPQSLQNLRGTRLDLTA